MRRCGAAALASAILVAMSAGQGWAQMPRVLRVGTFHGIPGEFTTIQAAVDAARPGNWVLVGPGDYKTTTSRRAPRRRDLPAAVLISTSRLRLRGMNRNTVIVDGTEPGSPRCSRGPETQNFGPGGRHGRLGLNGIMVWKARNVWVQNLTACNFLHGSGDTGNEIWWNGGDGSGRVGGHGFYGSYLTATSTFFHGERTAAQYGLFSSNWSGGSWDRVYTSNFNDSGVYIGACRQQCDQTLSHAHSQFSVLGYSGSNSGGAVIIKDSEFDHNQEGFDTNSQNGDNPPPQNGACPGRRLSPITHTHSCWVFMDNYVHDNNNPNVPSAGLAARGPVGTGMSVSGGRNDTVMHNRFVNNGAWGVLFLPFPDSGRPCTGGTKNSPLLGRGTCLYDEWGDALLDNVFTHNGWYGNPTNGDFEQQNVEAHPTDCFAGNINTAGPLTGDAASLQQAHPRCDGSIAAVNLNLPFINESVCDTHVRIRPFGCRPGDHYPAHTTVIMHPLPRRLATMPNPCAGVPVNPWCPGPRRGLG